MSDAKFKPFAVHAKCCDSILILARPRAYVACKCEKTAIDAGDGFYWRMNLDESAPRPAFYQARRGKHYLTRTKGTL